MAKDRARDGRRQFKDVGSMQRMGEALGFYRHTEGRPFPERESHFKKPGKNHLDRSGQPHVYDVEKEQDHEPTDRQMNPQYYSDTSSFTEGKVTYGKK